MRRMHWWLKRDADIVLNKVAAHFGVPVRTLRSRLRTPKASTARAFAMWALRKTMPLHNDQIADYFDCTREYVSKMHNVVEKMNTKDKMRKKAWAEAKENVILPKFF